MKFALNELEERFIASLKKSPKTSDDIIEHEKIGTLFNQALKLEVAELADDLQSVGTKFIDIWDLVNTKERYPEAIDILIEHIPKQYHDRNREGIFRALTVKEAKGKANKALIDEYNRIPKKKENLRWVIGNAIYNIVVKDDINSILNIVQDVKNGTSRRMFVLALGKVKSAKSEDILIKLIDEEEIAPSAIASLRRLNLSSAVDKVKLMTSHSNELIRKEAVKYLKKLD